MNNSNLKQWVVDQLASLSRQVAEMAHRIVGATQHLVEPARQMAAAAPVVAAPARATVVDTYRLLSNPPPRRPIDGDGFEPMTSLRRPAAIGLTAIVVGFGGFLVWSFSADLDSAAVASGSVIADSKKKTVSHLEGGILSSVLIAEGDRVKSGQPLLQLDDTRAQSDFSAISGSRIGLLARLARLRAEQQEQPIVFPPELLADKSTIAQSVMADEQHVFDKRRDIYQGNLAAQRKQIEQFEAEADAFSAQFDSAKQQEALVAAQLEGIRSLVEKGVSSKREASDLETRLSQITGNAGQYAAERARSVQQKAAGEIALLKVQMDWQGDVANDIQDTQLKLNDISQRMKVAQDTLDRLTVRAPQDGTVLNLQVRTPGSAITAGQPLLDIEPGNEPMIIEGKLSPLDIESVHVGAPAQVRLTAYDLRTHPPLAGRLLYIAADQTEDQQHGIVYYTVRAEIDPDALAANPGMILHPGMPAEVVIKRKSRKAIDYILDPITKSFYRAFRED
jgi:HlyD family secretion protein